MKKISDIDTLREYFRRVIKKAQHHAKGVEEIAYAILGAIIDRTDGDFIANTRNGKMTNQLHILINGKTYTLAYDQKKINVHDGNDATKPALIGGSFSNASTNREVIDFFRSL
jgi:hypothetical protein